MTDPIEDEDRERHLRSVDERTEDGDHLEPEPELFPAGMLEGDAKVTAQSLVKRHLPVQVTVSLSRAEVPTRSGLLNPDRGGRALVAYVPGKVEHVPEHDDDSGKVIGWKLRQHLRATFVTDANDEAALCRTAFEALLATDTPAAGALLAELRQMAEQAIGEPVA